MIARDDGMIGIHFMRLGMLALALGLFFGVIGRFQFCIRSSYGNCCSRRRGRCTSRWLCHGSS